MGCLVIQQALICSWTIAIYCTLIVKITVLKYLASNSGSYSPGLSISFPISMVSSSELSILCEVSTIVHVLCLHNILGNACTNIIMTMEVISSTVQLVV